MKNLRFFVAAALLAAAALLDAPANAAAPPAPANGAAGLDLDLAVTVDPAARRLSATATVRLPPGFSGAVFLHPAFDVTEAVAVRGAGGDAKPPKPGTAPQSPTPQGPVAQSPVAQSMENGWRRFAVPAGTAALKLTYRGALPALEPQNPAAGAGPEGAFLPAGSGWAPDDFGPIPPTWRLTLETPGGFVGVADGKLEQEDAAADHYRGRFSESRPVESPSVFVGPWTVTEQTRGGVRYRAYLHADQTGLAAGLIDAAAQATARYADQIGPYPFAGFSIVSAPLPVGLGFPGLTYIGRQVLPLPFVRDRSLAHEVLHNWWGNGVRVDTAQGNWAEGLTTYMADHAVAEMDRPAAAAAIRLDWLRDFAALPADREIGLRDCRNRRHDAQQVVCYGKAAMVFHMLRREIGDDAFAEGAREFWRRRQFAAAGWDDLRAAFETAAKRDLTGFFAQWLDRPGAPSLRLTDVAVDPAGVATVKLAQTSPPWSLQVPLRVDGDQGAATATATFNESTMTATLPAAPVVGKPLRVTVDPDHDAFRRLEPGETPLIVRDFTLRRQVATVVLGGAAEREAGRAVTAALFSGADAPAAPAAALTGDGPLAVLGISKDVAELTARLGVKSPLSTSPRVTGRAWTARTRSGRPVLIVEANDAAALAALALPLPHYRRESWVTFNGRTALGRGVWPTGDGGLSRSLETTGTATSK